MDLRTTHPEERDLIDPAVALIGTELTDFFVAQAHDAVRRIVADWERFELDSAALEKWEPKQRSAAR